MASKTDREAIFGVVPVLKKEKKYRFIDAFLITSGYAIATWCYEQGQVMAESLSFRQLVSSVMGPNLLFIALTCLPAILAVRYGVDLWIWLKSIFGDIGSKVVCVIVLIMELPWFAVCADMFAGSIIQMCEGFGLAFPPLALQVIRPIIGLVCVVAGFLIAVGGPMVIKWSSRIMVTGLLAVGVFVVFFAFSSASLKDILYFTPPETADSSNVAYFSMVEASAAFAVSWCLGLAVIPRLCKSERSGYWATAASYGIVAPFFVLAGGVMTIAMFLNTGAFAQDPTEALAVLGGPVLALLSLFLVAFANIGTAGCGTYIYSLVLKSAFPRAHFKWLALILAAYMGVLTLWGVVREYFLTFVSYSAFVLAPISAILIVDIFILRKQKVSLRALYNAHGCKGVNILGMICWGLGFLAGALSYVPISGEILNPVFYFTSATGFSFLMGGISYLLGSKIHKTLQERAKKEDKEGVEKEAA